ncbi:MAG: hypothetical protein IJ757_03490 [Clostridiales bacterium]|nr:hypothetical protein [Clostridiales bacterium]
MEYFDHKSVTSKRKGLLFTEFLEVPSIIMMILLIAVMAEEEDYGAIIGASIVLVLLIVLQVLIIYLYKMMERAAVCGEIFNEDHDGIITFGRLSEMTGYKEPRIRRDINWARKIGLYHNVNVDGDRIVLGGTVGASVTDEFQDVICPTCGATNRVRKLSSAKCKSCGSYLRRT